MNGNFLPGDDGPIEERLPYPTRPLYFPDGSSVEEFIIPERSSSHNSIPFRPSQN